MAAGDRSWLPPVTDARMDVGPQDPESRRFAAAAAALDRRVATAHERVECPTCSAPAGQRCRRMPAGFVGASSAHSGAPLRQSHDARLRAAGIALR